jgi:hypothetical protein
MPVHYRLIKYESNNQDYLDEQLGKSLEIGVHRFPAITITVTDVTQEHNAEEETAIHKDPITP